MVRSAGCCLFGGFLLLGSEKSRQVRIPGIHLEDQYYWLVKCIPVHEGFAID
jgi:hypothetical protein